MSSSTVFAALAMLGAALSSQPHTAYGPHGSCSRIEASVYFAPSDVDLGAPGQAVLRAFLERVDEAHRQGLEISPVVLTGFSVPADLDAAGGGLAVERARRVQTELTLSGAGLASILATPVEVRAGPNIGMEVLYRRVRLELMACGDRPAPAAGTFADII